MFTGDLPCFFNILCIKNRPKCRFSINNILEAERGTLNLSKAVRLLARCLFNEDELVVESIKDLDQNKVDLLHAETARWYNCTMTEVRQGNYP